MEHVPLITEQMLSAAQKLRTKVNNMYLSEVEAGDPALKEAKMEWTKLSGIFSEDPVDHLFPEHTSILMALPLFVTLDLISTIDKERAAKLKRRGVKADAKNDPKNLKYVTDELLNTIGFLVYPPLAPVTKELIEDLFVGIANYIVLSTVLRQYLEEKDYWYHVEWSDSIDFRTIPWKNRFPYAVNLLWLSLFVSLTDYRVVPEENGKTDQLLFPIKPVYISDDTSPDNSTIKPNDEGYDKDPPYCYVIFIQQKNQEDYGIAMIAYPHETGSSTLELLFVNRLDYDDPRVKNDIVNILMETEQRIIANLRALQHAWDNFNDTFGHIPIKNLDTVSKWMKTVVSRKDFMGVSFDSSYLRNTLISLDSNSKRDPDLVDLCKIYRKVLDKQHVSSEIIDAFREAMPFLQGMWDIIAADKRQYKSEEVREYVKQHKNQGFFTTANDAVIEGRRYHEDFDNNANRDFFEQLLVRLSAKKGWQVSRPAIRKLLNSKEI